MVAEEPDRPVGSPESDLPTANVPAGAESPGPDDRSITGAPPLPDRIGHYRIRRLIASGGMGTVYEAMQEEPHRRVALKVMRHGVVSRSALRRFKFESQLLARLRHPGIAQIYEAGTHDDGAGGVPYFAMEYIPNARAISEYARVMSLPLSERLELFARVCDAVHHGHQKGIIHRDLKPDNLLVDSSGQPKIIDFGVARATDSDMVITTLQTDVGQLIGTLQYMSPEQCDADPHDLDIRSDVYALGMVLYELLCERLPYTISGVSVYEAARLIRDQTPPRPHTIDPRLRGDVETICLKAIAKERERRYRSAAELGDDVRRFLNREPISASAPSALYYLRKFARRNRTLVGGIAAVFVLLLAGVVVMSQLLVRAMRAEQLAGTRLVESDRARAEAEQAETAARREAERAEAMHRFLIEDMLLAADPEQAPGRELTVREILENAARNVEGAFPDDPVTAARIRHDIGATFTSLGLYEPARDQFAIALELFRQASDDEDDSYTLQTMSDLAMALKRGGRPAEAEPLYRQVLERRRASLGAGHKESLETMNNLALLLHDEGRLAEAEEMMRDAVEGQERGGDDPLKTAEYMVNLAFVLESMDRLDEAEDLLTEAMSEMERIEGADSPMLLGAMNNYAVLLVRRGKLTEAETMRRQLLERQRQVYGDRHPDTLTSLNNLAFLLFRRDEHAEAEALFREVITASSDVLGEGHRRTLMSMLTLGSVLRSQGNHEQAEATLARAIRLYEEHDPGDELLWLIMRRDYGRCLLAMERREEAEPHLLASADGLAELLAPDHSRTVTAVRALIELYEGWEKPEEADRWRAKLPVSG